MNLERRYVIGAHNVELRGPDLDGHYSIHLNGDNEPVGWLELHTFTCRWWLRSGSAGANDTVQRALTDVIDTHYTEPQPAH